ncbi:MAG: sulfotransferase family 2 domain-containing protein [Flammeovirgaceae bacterium]
MLYSVQHQFLFTHVSRTGGVSLSQCLRQQAPDVQDILWQHAPLILAKQLLGEIFNQVYKFAFVRNPWERFVS